LQRVSACWAVDWELDRVNLAGLAGESALGYWLSLDLTRETALSAIALAAVSATVAGVVPAIAITGRAISQNIRGGSRVRFGRLTGRWWWLISPYPLGR